MPMLLGVDRGGEIGSKSLLEGELIRGSIVVSSILINNTGLAPKFSIPPIFYSKINAKDLQRSRIRLHPYLYR